MFVRERGGLEDLKDTTAEDSIRNYCQLRTRLGVDSSAACRHTGFTVLDQMKVLSHD